MKVRFLVLIYIFFIAMFANIFAQGLAVNTSGTEADASAILDVSSTTQGLLPPRMTNSERLLISSPAEGLFVYQTDGSSGLYIYNGSSWLYLAGQVVGSATVTTDITSNISSSSATSGGNVTNDGGASVTAKGVCWNTTGSPTTADDLTTDGSGTGSFTSSLTGLSEATTYYVRAYATNSEGTVYGSEESFNSSPVTPTLTTTVASDITATTATSGGNISYDGGAPVTARGIVWSTSQNPTTSSYDGIDTDASGGTGSFTGSLTGLTVDVTYYVRAYATNSAGTAYGVQESFTTAPVVGDYYQGGIVFYLDGSGGGLIAAESDQSSGVTWDDGTNTNTHVGSTSSTIGTGAANTSTIVSFFGAGSYAAQICNDLSLNGYTDWYLPSGYEILELRNNKSAVSGLSGTYWSSTQSSNNHKAASQSMTGSFNYYYDTNSSYKVRAIRAF